MGNWFPFVGWPIRRLLGSSCLSAAANGSHECVYLALTQASYTDIYCERRSKAGMHELH